MLLYGKKRIHFIPISEHFIYRYFMEWIILVELDYSLYCVRGQTQ